MMWFQKMIQDLDMRGTFYGFVKNQMSNLLHGFQNEIMNTMGDYMGGASFGRQRSSLDFLLGVIKYVYGLV